MSEPGILSAVGMCIESTWRNPPLTVISGARNKIGIAGTNPHRFCIVDSGGGIPAKPTVDAPSDEIDGDVQQQRTLMTAKEYAGGFTVKADGENLFYPLLGLFGRETTGGTTLTASASGMAPATYLNTFRPGGYAPSFTFEEIFGHAFYGRASSGYIVNSLEFTFSKTAVTCRITGNAYRQIPNTYPNASNAPTDYLFTNGTTNLLPAQMGGDGTKCIEITSAPTYIDVSQGLNGTGPFVFGNMAFGTMGNTGLSAGSYNNSFMSIDGVAMDGTQTLNGVTLTPVQIVEGSTLTFTRTTESTMVGGSGLDPGVCTGARLAVTGKINAIFTDAEILKATLRHADIGLNFQFVGPPIGSSGESYALEFFIPNGKFEESATQLVTGPIMVGGNFVGRSSRTGLGYSALVKLTSSMGSAGLGTAAPNAGGLGGWQSA